MREATGSSHTPVLKGRLGFLLVLIGTIFALYVLQLFNLQILNSSKYKQKTRIATRRTITIPAPRGEIFDRNYDLPLVINTPSYAVDIIPGEIPGKVQNTLFQKLGLLLNISVASIEEQLPKDKFYYNPVEIKSDVPFGVITRLAENIRDFNGVTWHKKPNRSYLESGSISHILGYTGTISKEELQVLYNKGYKGSEQIGKSGIEKQYDQYLSGTVGKRYKTVDVKGKYIEDSLEDEIPPKLGHNIVLTIDREIQKLCEQALGPRMGSVVVLKPYTGEVLALVSYPWYDANKINNKDYFNQLSLDPHFPFLIRPIQSSYAPASTFKTIMTTAILEEDAFDPLRTIDCEGSLVLGDRVFHCHKKEGHGPLDLEFGLAQSCDVYFWTVGREYLGVDNIIKYANLFGLGEKAGLDLPGEVSGYVPTPALKEKHKGEKWREGDTMNISIGQGDLQVTPLQMADVVAMIVNNGVVYKPHLLKEVRDAASGRIVKKAEKEILRSAVFKKETFQNVKKDMRTVVTDGSGKYVITTKAVQVAGKTGTGQVGLEDRWTAWFIAYGPYDTDSLEDKIVVVTMVEASNEWEWWAIRAANIIFQGIFAQQSYKEAVDALGWWHLVKKEGL